MKRVKTGIKGFDELIQGGFPQGSVILVCGAPGTGKTILGLEYLYNGAHKYKENGLYVTFEQRTDELLGQGKQFGWEVDELVSSKKLNTMYIPVKNLTKNTVQEIKDAVSKYKIKRLVLDSLTTLATNAPVYSEISNISVKDMMGDNVIFSPPVVGDFVVSRFIYTFIEDLKNLKCTTLLIGEASGDGKTLTKDSISEFLCDGVVLINFESLGGDYSRSLIVRKMRHTKNNEDVHPMEISKAGLVVHDLK